MLRVEGEERMVKGGRVKGFREGYKEYQTD